jgi:hypothetical protein
MKTIFRLLVFVLLVAGWGLAALSVHVVRTPEQVPVTLVTKERLGIRDTYVDTTKWTLDDVSKHPGVVEQLVRSGKVESIKHVAKQEAGDLISQITDALQRAPRDVGDSSATQPVSTATTKMSSGKQQTASRQRH